MAAGLRSGRGPPSTDVVAALTLVLADVQPPAPVELAVGWAAHDARDWSTLCIEATNDRVPISGKGHELLLEQIADQLQEHFFPETTSAWGQTPPAPAT